MEVDEKSNLKEHMILIGILVIILLIFFSYYGYFKPEYMPGVGNDFNDNHIGLYHVLKESLSKYSVFFPLWNKYLLGGTNYLEKATNPDLLYPLNWLVFLINPIELSSKMILMICFIIASIGMYSFVYFLTKNAKAAFISSLFYVFCGFSLTLLSKGWSEYIRSFCLIPFIFLLMIKAFNSKEWIIYSMAASVLLVFQVFAGGAIMFLWTLVLICLFFIFKFIECLIIKKNFIKLFLIAAIILIFSAGLSAIRTMPASEYLKYSDRAGGVSYEQSLWQKITFECKEDPNYCIWGLIEPSTFPKVPPSSGFGFKIGIVGVLLVLLGIYSKFKNKYVLFFSFIIIISILISLGTPLYYLLFKYAPGFSTHRYPHRALILFSFAASVIIGYGYIFLLNKLKHKFKIIENKERLFYFLLILIILLDLLVLGYPLSQQVNINQEIENNEIYNYIAEQNGTFRTHVQDIYSNTRGLNHLLIPLGIQFTYGYEQTFNTEYLPIFLSIANSDPAKFFGISNVKYITSSKEINISGYNFIKKFNYSKYTRSEESNQTYLYENKLFVPRYLIVPNAVLVVGESDSAKEGVYWLMLNKNFDPKKSIIIKGKKSIADYSISDLTKFKAVVLTKDSVDQSSLPILQKYVENGNILLPDITKNKQTFNESDIARLFGMLKDSYKEIIPSYYSPDKVTFELKDKGFIFISEQYSIYPGGRVFVDGKEKDILRADGVFSSVYIDGTNSQVIFEYKPKSFIYGAIISTVSLLIILIYMIYFIVKDKKQKNGIQV